MELRPLIGRSGRAVVAGATGVVVNEHLLRPTAEMVVRVSELPSQLRTDEAARKNMRAVADRVSELVDETGVQAVFVVLSEQGSAAAKTLRADEALPLFAISVGASVVRTDERIVPADGVGAVLRYAPTLH